MPRSQWRASFGSDAGPLDEAPAGGDGARTVRPQQRRSHNDGVTRSEREAYTESVLRVVEAIPAGKVLAYGDVATLVGSSGPRRVGRVLAEYGGGVPWWRVVRADGGLPPSHGAEALRRYAAEGTPVGRTAAGRFRIDIGRAAWTTPGPWDAELRVHQQP